MKIWWPQTGGYHYVVTKIEAELDGLPIFDDKTYDRIRGYWTQTEKFISDYNRLIESLEKRETHKVQLVDKDQYFLKISPPDPEFTEQWVRDIKSMVDAELSKFTPKSGLSDQS